MRDSKRIDTILEAIRELWTRVPDWRLGQLIENACCRTYSMVGDGLFYTEDSEMLKGIISLIESHERNSKPLITPPPGTPPETEGG